METRCRLEQESHHAPPPGDHPVTYNRLVSFGSLDSSSYPSFSDGSSQIFPISHPLQLNYHKDNGELNHYCTSSIGSSIRHSPVSSGMTTPIHNVSPLHLQHIREQMVVALKRLKELEEQAKTIPVLQVKIAVLLEEKRLANTTSKKMAHCFSGDYRKRSYSVDSARQLAPRPPVFMQTELNNVELEAQEMSIHRLEELATEVQNLDMHNWENEPDKVEAELCPNGSHKMLICKVADENINKFTIAQNHSPSKVGPCFRDTGVMTETHGMQSKGVGVSEVMLCKEAEVDIQLQQHTIEDLKDKLYQLEVKLKDTTQEVEMYKLKLELKSAEGSSRKMADKSSMARPEMYCASVEAKVQTYNQGVGSDLEFNYTSTAKTIPCHCVGVYCHPVMCNIGVGSEVSMDKWVVRKRIELNDKCVGRQVVMCHQSVGPDCNSNSEDTTQQSKTTDSCTNTLPNTSEKHTNVAIAETRSVAIGEGLVKDSTNAVKMRSVAVGAVLPIVKSATSKTKECGVGMISIQQNFLVGLKTRSIACGSCPPVDLNSSTGTIQAVSQQMKTHGDNQLDHYIEKVQKLLEEQQMLLTENYTELADTFGQPHSQFGAINTELTNTITSINSVMKCVRADEVCDILQLHQDSSSINEHTSCSVGTLKPIMKKKDERPGCYGVKINMPFVGINGGYDTASCSEESSSLGSKKDQNKEECKQRKASVNIENQTSSEEFLCKVAVNLEKNQVLGSPVQQGTGERFELSESMLAACNILKTQLNDPTAVISKDVRACMNTVQHEWFRVSSEKSAVPGMVEDYLFAFLSVSPSVLFHVVNMADSNGNTALHYSVSHSNFQIVKKLLDADVCDVNQQNKAGYTPIMLAALAPAEAMKDMQIVEELFSKGDVNARASQAGQTGLMLAVSHGRTEMVRALLAQGAEVNVQDYEGSTALMCASEHGHVEIVKLLLAQPGCDSTLRDSDGSSALSIALEAGHKDIGVLLYAHVNFSKAQSPGSSCFSRKMSPNATRRGIFE